MLSVIEWLWVLGSIAMALSIIGFTTSAIRNSVEIIVERIELLTSEVRRLREVMEEHSNR